jgi:hypothetical protein
MTRNLLPIGELCLTAGKEFKNIQMSVFDSTGRKSLRVAPALPWHIESSLWYARALQK